MRRLLLRCWVFWICWWAGAAWAGAPGLRAGRVSELGGEASLIGASGRGAPLRAGEVVPEGGLLRTGAGAGTRLQIEFPAGGGLLRLGPGAEVGVELAARRVMVRSGRVLLQGDVMVGGLSAVAGEVACVPLGTTYVVEVSGRVVDVMVLEGAVEVRRAGWRDPVAVVLPGEGLRVEPGKDAGKPVVRDLRAVLAGDPAVVGYRAPLPTQVRILDLAEQQRRGVLRGRNERLRRELTWRRRPRAKVVLPPPFGP